MGNRKSTSHRWLVRMATASAGLAVVGLVAVTPPAARAQEPADDGVRLVGTLPRPHDRYFRPMAVDETRSIGFVADGQGFASFLHMMDLERLVPIARTPTQMRSGDENSPNQPFGYTPEASLALDSARERLYVTGHYPGNVQPSCTVDDPATANGPRRGQPAFDYRADPAGTRRIEQRRIGPMPCTGDVPFAGLTGSYDEVSKRLYIAGTPYNEMWRPLMQLSVLQMFSGGTFQEDRGQPLLLRQLEIGPGDTVPSSDQFAQSAAQPKLEWELDLRLAGCGRREHMRGTLFQGFVARVGTEVLAYCWDGRPYRGLQQGQQGYLVRIPLGPDPSNPTLMRPLTRGGAPVIRNPDGPPQSIANYEFRRIPTLPGPVTPILDRETGRVMLVTTGATNGNAVWVFDADQERFVGVITGGYADEQVGNTAVGFDSTRGRVYVLTQNGLLVAPIRSDPLPVGLLYPVLVNEDRVPNFVGSERISVAPELGRLFVDRRTHYDVLEDRIPNPPAIKPVDPDSLTSQVPEKPGQTVSSASGQAIASGVHVVNTGGTARALGQNDPTCIFSPPNQQTELNEADEQDPIPDWELAPALFGSCIPELAITPGHREAEAAATRLEAGTGSGVSARGAAFMFGSTDTGSDGDIRRFTDCGASTPDQVDRWGRRWPFPEQATLDGTRDHNGKIERPDPVLSRDGHPNFPGSDKRPYEKQYNEGRDQFWGAWTSEREDGQAQYGAGCNQLQDGMAENGAPDLRTGTKGTDGSGVLPAAVCGDFGGAPSGETWPAEAAGQPQVGYPSSSVSCDAAHPKADGLASIGPLAFPSTADPVLSVGRVWSRVSTSRTSEGQVTVAVAVAEGVVAGPLSIAQIRSVAITKAHGHADTADASLVRQLCGIRVADRSSEGCVDADSPDLEAFLDDVNFALLEKVQLSVPSASAQATPGGYQAVVTKHPGQRGGDQTVNDDDSHTVGGLQAIIYNDGPKGRSRLIVQLAGVHAESRYGIIQLPDFGPPFNPPPAPPDPGPTEQPPAPPAAPPASPPPPADVFTPPAFVDDVPFEVERTSFSSPTPTGRVVMVPSGGSPATRILRIPVQALKDAIQLLVQNPREAGLLFVMFALLAMPFYLGLRRRSFAAALTS